MSIFDFQPVQPDKAKPKAAANPFLGIRLDDGPDLHSAAVNAAEYQPEALAKAQDLSARVGVPAPVLARNPDEAARLDLQHRLDQVRQENPALASWLTEGDNLALAKDDLGPLAKVDSTWKQYLDSLNVSTLYTGGGILRSTAELLSPQKQLYASLPDSNPAKAVLSYSAFDPMAAKGAEMADAAKQASADSMVGVEQPKSYTDALLHPWKYRGYLTRQAIQSVGPMAVAVGLRKPQVAAESMGIFTGAQTYAQDRAEGVSPTMALADATGQAVLEKGFGAATFEVAQNPALKAWQRVVLAGATENVTEGATGASQYALGSAFGDKPFDARELLKQTVESGLIGQALGSGVGAVEVAASYKNVAKVEDSTQGATLLETLHAAANESKLAKRSPQAMASLVASLAAQGGPQEAFIGGEDFVGLFQSEAVAAQAAADLTGDPEALNVALAGNGDLAIPMAKFVPFLASDVGAQAVAKAKLDPEHLTVAETRATDREAAVGEFVKAMETALGSKAQVQADVAQQDILGELVATGRYSPGDAEQMAKLLPRFYANIATATGRTVDEVRAKYPVAVLSDTIGERLRRTNPQAESLAITPVLDAIRSGKIPSKADVYGPSLVDTLVKAGGLQDYRGELRVMDAGKVRKGLMGGALSLDEALALAQEQGFINANPDNATATADTNTLLDLIRQDLMDGGVYRSVPINAQLAGLRETALAWEKELPGLLSEGETLQDLMAMSNADILKRAREMVRDAYEQDATNQTDTPAFRKWFGDSKVVDAEGKPLVVYHGTTANITQFDESRRGENTGAESAKQGFFFTDDVRTAGSYAHYAATDARVAALVREAEQAERAGDWDKYDAKVNEYETLDASFSDFEARLGGQNIVPVFLSIQNPLDVDAKGENAIGFDIPAAIKRAVQGGHDGLIIRNLDDAAGLVDADATHYVVFGSTQIKSATGNRGTFDPNDPSILNQPGDGGARGNIQFPRAGIGNGESIIRLAETADSTTFLHETGHLFLEIMANEALAPDAAPAIARDFGKVLDWFGVTAEQWAGFDLEAKRPYHEQFARGFEQYLGEGKAPAHGLRSAFRKFKAWVLAVYKDLKALNVTLTDDVRGVFDRMLATEDEINAAAKDAAFEPALPADEARKLGMSEAAIAKYQQTLEKAREALGAKVLNAKFRETRAWYRQQVQAMREVVKAEADAMPVYRSIAALRKGEGVQVKLDKGDLVRQYGEAILPRFRGMYAVEGGVSLDLAADALGWATGKEMAEAILNAKPKAEFIKAEADARVREAHGDPMTDGTIASEAMAALHNSRLFGALQAEMDLLAKLANEPPVPAGAIREAAARVIAKQTSRTLRPHQHLVAERKAANEAQKAAAAGKYAEALAAKRQQAFNAALYAEARAAESYIDRARKYLRKFDSKAAQQRLGKTDYRDAVNTLLDAHDLRSLTGKAIDRRENLAAFVERQAAKGITVDLPARLLADLNRRPLASLTVGEVKELRDAVKHMDHLSILKDKLLRKGEWVDRMAVDSAMADSVRANNRERPAQYGDKTAADHARKAFYEVRALQGTATDLARELDGFKDGGAVWENTAGLIREVIATQTNPEMEAAQVALANNYHAHYSRAEIRALTKAEGVAGVPGRWSKESILALALNWGNEGNRQAILSQAKARLTPEQVGRLLNTLTAKDWGFVQGAWAQVNAYWPRIAEAQRKRTGVAPEKVPASPFTVTTADGQTLNLEGGYYPLKYEADSTKTVAQETASFYEDIRTGKAAKAATRRGHTEERVGSGGRTVQLNLGVLEGHLRSVVRDLTLGDSVNFVHQALSGPGFGEAVTDTGLLQVHQAMETWLKDVAAGEMSARTWHERAMRATRTNFTAAVLTWKVASAALQVTGYVQTSVVLGKKHTLIGLKRFLSHPVAALNYVSEASPFMAARAQSHVEAVQQLNNARQGRYAAGKSAMIRWGYFMIGQVQRTVDLGTWLGAEAKGLEQFNGDAKKARAYADDVVARAQGSGEFSDKTAIQRGTLGENVRQSEFIRTLSALQGYMYAKGNVAYERTATTNFRNLGEAFKWGGDMVLLFAVEAMIAGAIRGMWPDDEDEDGSRLDDVALWTVKETGANLFGSVPGLGGMVTEIRGYDSKNVVGSMWEAVGNTVEQAQQGEADKAAVKAAVVLAGYGAGVPSSQINKTVDAIAKEQGGADVSPLEYVMGPDKKPSQ